MNHYILEICVDSLESALAGEKGGASRLELCSNLILGGTTPSKGLIDLVKEAVTIPFHVLIRPRFGDFCYTDFEFEIIKRDIQMAKSQGANGIVIGILTPDGHLDVRRLEILIDLAKPLHITLHRAFDMCKDPFLALEEAKKLKIHTILTSGQQQTSLAGTDCLSKLIKEASNEIEIMVGSGLTSHNILAVVNKTNAKAYHLSGKKEKESPMRYRPESISMGLPILSEYTLLETDWREVRKVKDILDTV